MHFIVNLQYRHINVDIQELAGFTGGSSFFYFTKNCFLTFLIDDRLFVTYNRFSNTSCKF